MCDGRRWILCRSVTHNVHISALLFPCPRSRPESNCSILYRDIHSTLRPEIMKQAFSNLIIQQHIADCAWDTSMRVGSAVITSSNPACCQYLEVRKADLSDLSDLFKLKNVEFLTMQILFMFLQAWDLLIIFLNQSKGSWHISLHCNNPGCS